jgi:predicted branched-subunit amino acid permease
MTPSSQTPTFTRAALFDGAVAMTPIVLSQTAFGIVFGTFAAQKGLTFIETVTMSGAVYGGLSQVVGLQGWPTDFTLSALFALMLATFAVNLRFFLMSLTFRPWLGGLPAWKVYPTLLFITDANWLRTMRYRDEGGNDVCFFLGGGILLYVTWMLATGLGFVFSAWMTNPKAYGIDLLIPAFFASLLIPAWKGPRHAVPWLVSGLVAVAVHHVVGGYWYIIAGAISGTIAAGLFDDK